MRAGPSREAASPTAWVRAPPQRPWRAPRSPASGAAVPSARPRPRGLWPQASPRTARHSSASRSRQGRVRVEPYQRTTPSARCATKGCAPRGLDKHLARLRAHTSPLTSGSHLIFRTLCITHARTHVTSCAVFAFGQRGAQTFRHLLKDGHRLLPHAGYY